LGLTDPQPTKALNAEKVSFALKTQYTYSATDTVSLCQFVFGPGGWQIFGPQEIADVLTSTTGWEIGIDEMQEIGRRRVNMMRAFNAREGLARDADTLPKKLFKQALKGGRSDGIILEEAELAAGLDMYYEQAGWNVASGTPTRATLEDVGLGWVADDLGL
jgi:aldehyde:ferredoxin oxidoreductase